jgi:hypothetical protein
MELYIYQKSIVRALMVKLSKKLKKKTKEKVDLTAYIDSLYRQIHNLNLLMYKKHPTMQRPNNEVLDKYYQYPYIQGVLQGNFVPLEELFLMGN